MGQEPGTVGAALEAAKDPEQIREEIEATRRELGDTVEALAAKADVKAHVRKRVERTKVSLPNPVVLGVAAVAAVVAVGLVAWRLSRR
jgi:type VI protein secretion system component VasF